MTKKEAANMLRTLNLTISFAQPRYKDALAIAIAELDRQYTSEPPTMPGGYWWKGDDPCSGEEDWTECVRHVFKNWESELLTYVKSRPCRVNGIGGLWCGPLTPPE